MRFNFSYFRRGNDGLFGWQRKRQAKAYRKGPGNKHLSPEERQAINEFLERRTRDQQVR